MKFRKKPIIIEAEQLTWANWSTICEFAEVGKLADGRPEGTYLDENEKPTTDPTARIGLLIPTKEGVMIALEEDWVIKGLQGELYPCKSYLFEATFEPVEEDQGLDIFPKYNKRLREIL